MRKLLMVAATAIGAVVMSASPMSVKLSAETVLSLSQDKAFAEVGRPGTPGSVAGVPESGPPGGAALRGGSHLPSLLRHRL